MAGVSKDTHLDAANRENKGYEFVTVIDIIWLYLSLKDFVMSPCIKRRWGNHIYRLPKRVAFTIYSNQIGGNC